jgi:hypothetical protein
VVSSTAASGRQQQQADRQLSAAGVNLGLLLWGLARLQYVPARGLLAAAAARAMQLGPGNFTPQTLAKLLHSSSLAVFATSQNVLYAYDLLLDTTVASFDLCPHMLLLLPFLPYFQATFTDS